MLRCVSDIDDGGGTQSTFHGVKSLNCSGSPLLLVRSDGDWEVDLIPSNPFGDSSERLRGCNLETVSMVCKLKYHVQYGSGVSKKLG